MIPSYILAIVIVGAAMGAGFLLGGRYHAEHCQLGHRLQAAQDAYAKLLLTKLYVSSVQTDPKVPRGMIVAINPKEWDEARELGTEYLAQQQENHAR
jgi:hypothetical protein